MSTTAPIYPEELPCAIIAGTAAEISAAVIRTPFQSGNVKQRRLHRRMPHLFRLSWVLKQDNAYAYWLNWINLYGYNWHWQNLASSEAGAQTAGEEYIPHLVRLTNDLSTELVQGARGFFWRVTATAEWVPTASYINDKGPATVTLNWIIAQTPASPSADWYISNAPGSQPTDWVFAGTPSSPSAFV